MPMQKKTNETIYEGRDVWVNQRTGEIIEADQVVKKVRRTGFEITYLAYFFDLFDQLGGKKYKVFKYIISHKDNNNTLIMTTKELAKKAEVSEPTVISTLKLLKDAGLIQQRTGAVMLHPQLAHRGSDNKELFLLQKFQAFDDDKETK